MKVEADPTDLVLSLRDRNSETWLKVRTAIEARIEQYRRQNDNDLAPDKTAILRGRIQELKNLLAAGESQDQHQ